MLFMVLPVSPFVLFFHLAAFYHVPKAADAELREEEQVHHEDHLVTIL